MIFCSCGPATSKMWLMGRPPWATCSLEDIRQKQSLSRVAGVKVGGNGVSRPAISTIGRSQASALFPREHMFSGLKDSFIHYQWTSQSEFGQDNSLTRITGSLTSPQIFIFFSEVHGFYCSHYLKITLLPLPDSMHWAEAKQLLTICVWLRLAAAAKVTFGAVEVRRSYCPKLAEVFLMDCWVLPSAFGHDMDCTCFAVSGHFCLFMLDFALLLQFTQCFPVRMWLECKFSCLPFDVYFLQMSSKFLPVADRERYADIGSVVPLIYDSLGTSWALPLLGRNMGGSEEW